MVATFGQADLISRVTDISAGDSLDSIVLRYPETQAVFDRFGLDSELGWLPIESLAAEQRVDITTLRAVLRGAVAAADIQCMERPLALPSAADRRPSQPLRQANRRSRAQ